MVLNPSRDDVTQLTPYDISIGMNAWMISPDGQTDELDAGCTVADILGAKIGGFVLLAPGLRMWHCRFGPFNAAATALLDALSNPDVDTLPRIRGPVVVESYMVYGEICMYEAIEHMVYTA